MAEFVEKRLEEQLPEIEEMERIGILSHEEIRQLIIKRRHFEYKIGSVTPCKTDYLAALNYTAQLLELIKIRRKKLRMFEKFEQIEKPIMQRQEQLLTKVTRRYFTDFRFWDMRINFAKNVGHDSVVTAAYKEMTMKHSRLLSVWVQWAHFEMTVRKNFQQAREILLSKAPLHHPNSRVLRRELFRFELLHLEHLFEQQLTQELQAATTGDAQPVGKEEAKLAAPLLMEAEKKVFSGSAVILVYNSTVKEHQDFDTARQLYDIVAKFPFAGHIREMVYGDILARFPATVELLLLKAHRRALGLSVTTPALPSSQGKDDHLRPFRIYAAAQSEKKNKLKPLWLTAADRKNMLTLYLDVLETGFDSVDSESSSSAAVSGTVAVESDALTSNKSAVPQSFAVLYVQHTLSLLYHVWGCSVSRALVVSRLCGRCMKHRQLLGPEELLVWAALLDAFPQPGAAVSGWAVREAARLHPTHPPTLVYALQHTLRHGDLDAAAVLEEYTLLQPLLPLPWLRVAYHSVTSHLPPGPSRTTFLEEQAKGGGDVEAAKYTRLALLWSTYQEGGLSAARAVYQQYRYLPPLLDELHATMCLLELCGDGTAQGDGITDAQQEESSLCYEIDERGDVDESDGDELECGDEVECDDEVEGDNEVKGEDRSEVEGDGGNEMEGQKGGNEAEAKEEEKDGKNSNGYEEGSCSEKDETDDEEQEKDEDEEEEQNSEDDAHVSVLPLSSRPDVERIRNIFKTAVRQSGGSHHEVWLSYTEFEDRLGDALEAGRLRRRAETDMTGCSVQAFRDTLLDIRRRRWAKEKVAININVGSSSSSSISEDEEMRLGSDSSVLLYSEKPKQKTDVAEPADDAKIVGGSEDTPIPLLLALPRHQQFLRPRKKAKAKRTELFKIFQGIRKHLHTTPSAPRGMGLSWLDVLTALLDRHRVQRRPPLPAGDDEEIGRKPESAKQQLRQFKEQQQSRCFTPGNKLYKTRSKFAGFQGSDTLHVSESEENPTALRRRRAAASASTSNNNNIAATAARDDIDVILASSDTLQSDFVKKTEIQETISKTRAKKIAKKERAKTAGKGWDFMKAPEMTPELERDLELLRIRGILDPKQRFKSTHMKVAPKYFQVGTLKADHRDYYTRLTKKQRKRTLAEEIMNDQDIVRYQKRKYSQLVAKREANRFRKRRKTSADYIKV